MTKAEGRSIHITLDIIMEPAIPEKIGHTDGGMQLAKEIVDDIAQLLHIIAINEGFKIDVERRNTVY